MNLKGLFSSLLKTTEDKERRDKDLLREIMLFVNQIKKEYSLEGFVNVQLIDELPINQGISVFGNNICNVQIGIKECRKRNELLEREWITLKNTIIHELTHVKNRVELAQDTQKKIKNNIHSLTYFAVQLVDEYNAYKAADDRFKQFRIGCEESVLQRALQLFWLNEHFIQVTGLDDKSRYNHFYDNCTAIIVHSIRSFHLFLKLIVDIMICVKKL
jgi:hypothetical protein